MRVFEFRASITNTGTHNHTQMFYDADKRTEWKENKNSPSHTQNTRFLLIIIKYFTVVCRFRPMFEQMLLPFFLYLYLDLLYRLVVLWENDAQCGVCECVYVCFCALTQHANAFSTNPTTKCVCTQLLGERKIIITTITTIATNNNSRHYAMRHIFNVCTNRQPKSTSIACCRCHNTFTMCALYTYISIHLSSYLCVFSLFVFEKYLHFPWRSSRSNSRTSSGTSNKTAVNIIMQTMIFDFSINTWYRKASFAWMVA